MSGCRLAVLLPVTSTTGSLLEYPHSTDLSDKSAVQSICSALSQLAVSMHGSGTAVTVLLGIDSDDQLLVPNQQLLVDALAAANLPVHVMLFNEADRAGYPSGALCHLWGLMAKAAQQYHGCNLAVLLGDDTEVSPLGWPELIVSTFEQRPELMLLLLNDAADPGFPSFPVLRLDRHLALFGRLLPSCFINQGGDPFLAALYRRFEGCLDILQHVTVTNHIGGVQCSGRTYSNPRYSRCTVSKDVMLDELARHTRLLEATDVSYSCTKTDQAPADPAAVAATTSTGNAVGGSSYDKPTTLMTPSAAAGAFNRRRVLAIDVLVPTARMDLMLLQNIAETVLSTKPPLGSDLALVLIVDQPVEQLSTEQQEWLRQLQTQWLYRVRVRINEHNLGASATRNRGLQESLADYVIMWDDDIKPSAGCLAAYVEAMQQNPQAMGFAGPSYVPKDPSRVWPCAIHLADVLFFWNAAANWQVAEVLPWAVTANLAVRNTPHEFDMRFPKTGGGEDIDFCLKVTDGKMVPVPKATVHHPLWNNGNRCYNRFFGWAYGDGALIAMYPRLCYYSFPCSAEACCALLLLVVLAAVGACVVFAAGRMLHLCASVLTDTPGTYAVHAVAFAAMTITWSCTLLRCSLALLQAAVGFKLLDVLLDIIRSFHPVRQEQHNACSMAVRLVAGAEASFIKPWSETGRICGITCRGEMQTSLCKRFDWFCGLAPHVVAGEKLRAFWRFSACSMGGLTAVFFCWLPWNFEQAPLQMHIAAAATAAIACCASMIWMLEA